MHTSDEDENRQPGRNLPTNQAAPARADDRIAGNVQTGPGTQWNIGEIRTESGDIHLGADPAATEQAVHQILDTLGSMQHEQTRRHFDARFDDLLGQRQGLVPGGRLGRPPAWIHERLVGRASDLTAILESLRSSRPVVGLIGPGGVGKTSLAREAALAYLCQLPADGAWAGGMPTAVLADATIFWYDLPAHDPTWLRHELAHDLALADPETAPWDAVRRALGTQRHAPLVVLNDLPPQRNLGIGWAQGVDTLVQAGCAVIWTSRRRFPTLADHYSILKLQPLRGETALTCLVDALHPDAQDAFRSATTAEQAPLRMAAEQLLGGLPLALRLAAKQISPRRADWPEWSDHVAHTRTRLNIPDDAERSVRAAFALSWIALSTDEQERFALLGLFPDEFAFHREAVTALWRLDHPREALRGLRSLEDDSLVTCLADGERARLHPLLAAFAREQLSTSAARAGRAALIEYYRQFTLAYHTASVSSLGAIAREWPVILLVCDWAGTPNHVAALADLALGLATFLFVQGHWGRAGQSILECGIAAAAHLGWQEREAFLLYQLGNILLYQADFERARAFLEKSLALSQVLADRTTEAAILHALGHIAVKQGFYDTARGFFAQSLTLQQEINDLTGQANNWHQLGTLALNQGNWSEATALLENALALWRIVGDRAGEARTLKQLGRLALEQGDLASAQDLLKLTLTLRQEVGDRGGEAATRDQLGRLALLLGEYPQAEEQLTQSLALWREVGDRSGEATTLRLAGMLAGAREQYAEARELLVQSMTLLKAIGSARWWATSAAELGRLVFQGWGGPADPVAAFRYWIAASTLLEPMGVPEARVYRQWCENERQFFDWPDATTCMQIVEELWGGANDRSIAGHMPMR